MAVEVIQPTLDDNILARLPVRYYERDGAGVVYDDQFYLYNEYGERVSETTFHSDLNRYLFEVLRWAFYKRISSIYQFLEYRFDRELSELEIEMRRAKFKPASDEANMTKQRVKVEPDLAIFLDIAIVEDEASFTVGEGKQLPPPHWLLETASPGTFERDLDIKFKMYRDALKAKEYIVFDPHEKQLWQGSRLKAWRLQNNEYVPLPEDEQGRLWSEVLQSWLVVEGRYLRLYDAQGERRLTQLEHTELLLEQERFARERLEDEMIQVQIQMRQERIELERTKVQVEQAQVEKERVQAQAERAQSQLEQARSEKEQVQNQFVEVQAEKERIQVQAERERTEKETAQRRIAELEVRLKAMESGQ